MSLLLRAQDTFHAITPWRCAVPTKPSHIRKGNRKKK